MMRTLTLLLVAVFGMYAPAMAQISVSIAVTGGSNPTCKGRNVTFSATPTNAGTLPNYLWMVNGLPVPGGVGGSFTTNSLSNGDFVTVQVQRSSAPFDSALSPAILMVVVPNLTPTVTKAITAGTNPGCQTTQIQFTATATNAGLAPTFRWYINGISVGTGAVYNNFTAVTGDRIFVRALASGSPTACYTTDTAYSDTTTLVRLPVPALPVISFIGHYLVSDSANVQWYGPAGILPGATGSTFHPVAQGQYYAVIPNPVCGTGKSNVLIVSPLEVGNYNMSDVQLYPNPTTGLLTINWGAPKSTRITVFTPAGQMVYQDAANTVSSKVVDLSRLASGMYFVMLQDESGARGTVKVTVSH